MERHSEDMTERKTHLSNARLHAQLSCVPFCIRVWWRSNLSMTCTHTYTYDRLASETYTHAQPTSHVLPGEGGRVCYNELVPSRLSARVSQWRCLRESNVCHANRCGLSARTNTDAHSSTLSHAWRAAPGTWLDSTHTLFHLPMSIPLTLKSTKKHKHTHMHNYTHIRCSNEGSY